jgi:hypothetical protein
MELTMAKRNADAAARSRVRDYLHEHGPVEDSDGGATARLRAASGYQGSAIAFIQLITAMDEAGEIVREIRGKRTYAIRPAEPAPGAGPVGAAAPATGPGAPSGDLIDYERLAQALLRELGRALASDASGAVPAARPKESDRILELARERDLLRAERDEYAAQLGAARRKLDGLLALYVRDNKRESAGTVQALELALAQLRGASRAESGKRAG